MSDKTREIYTDKAETMTMLNPFVDMPRMRMSTVNRLNELIKKDTAMPLVEHEYTDSLGKHYYSCPRCNQYVWTVSEENPFCSKCGQRIDVNNIAL